MGARAALREAVERWTEGLPPERRLRVALAADAISRHARGRQIAVLDAGCGDAPLARTLARRRPGWRVVAADYHEESLERGRRLAEDEGLALEFALVDLTQPFADAQYDAIASLEVLTEVPDDGAVVANMARALAPGGLLFLTSMDRDWQPILRGSAPTWRDEIRHGYTAGELDAMIRSAGLVPQRVRPLFRRPVRLAEELNDRVRRGAVRKRAALHPFARAAVGLERRGLVPGPGRGWIVEARRP